MLFNFVKNEITDAHNIYNQDRKVNRVEEKKKGGGKKEKPPAAPWASSHVHACVCMRVRASYDGSILR